MDDHHHSSMMTHFNIESNREVFIRLVFGLNAYLKARDAAKPAIPNTLRLALNRLAFETPQKAPKTMYQLIHLAHQPLSWWYFLDVPDSFNVSQPLLVNNHLSDEAQEFYLDWVEKTDSSQEDIPQAALDNVLMQELRDRLKSQPDVEKAQRTYETIRRFLIKHSWVTQDTLRAQLELLTELRVFYEPMLPVPVSQSRYRVCSRCGLLVWRGKGWHGMKPSYCSDHADDSPFIEDIPRHQQMYRLREGIHLRTFIPGRLELALFEGAETMDASYPDHVVIEHYPGLDAYDMRLSFSDGEVWAIDAKDQAYPKRLAQNIGWPYGEGKLAYNQAFFVLPDERMSDEGYAEQLMHALGDLPEGLHVLSLSDFQGRFDTRMKALAKPSARKTKKEQ